MYQGLPIKMGLLRLLLVAALSGCQATQYQPAAPREGFGEMELAGNIWRVRFAHNASTTRETAQSYWLYRAAELALSRGYDGFEVLSQVSRARSSGDALSRSSALLIEGEIRMLKKPFESVPPKTYNAEAIKAVLDPYVTGATDVTKSGPAPVVSKVETSPSSSEALRLKMMYAIPTESPAPAPVEKPKPAPVVARPTAPPVPAPLVARPQARPAAESEPSLKRTGPCEVKPVMTDQDLVNCGALAR